MNNRFLWLILLGLAALLAACGSPETAQPAAVDGSPVPTPVAGKAVVVGRVLSKSTGEPLIETIVRLAEVYREGGEGAFVLDGFRSPGGVTDAKGEFLISDIEPVEYVVIIGDVYDRYEIIADANGDARVWQAQENAVLDVGELSVDLTP